MRPLDIPRFGVRTTEGREPIRAAAVAVISMAIAAFLGVAANASGDEPGKRDGPPSRASDLFRGDRVWTLHLSFTPERWAAMEPEGGTNPFAGPDFGMGMFLAPAVMRDGDRDKSGGLSSAEFRDLGGRWFAAWDRDGDGVVDTKQIREGLKGIFTPPGRGDGPGSEGPGGPPPGTMLQGKDGKRNGLSGMMGIEFEYVHADLEFEGRRFADVAVRYKGNGTFLESRSSLKRSLKVDLNRFAKGRKLAGVSTLNLHNNVTDAGMMNEALAHRLYRDAGIPAPRTAYARVFVTVPGKHDRKYLGLYSLVENVDRDFVADRRLGDVGAIFKPSTPDLFADLGDDWGAYQQTYDPKTELTAGQKRRVIAFCRLITRGTDEEVAAQLGDFVDLDEFARFLAVTAWIGDLDSILTNGQNYYMFLDPKRGRFQFIPWDKDHTFGSWIGDYSERVRHSIREPWEGRKRFLERAFKVDAFRERYLAAMAKLAEEQARPERIEAQVGEVAAVIRPAVKEESAEKLSRFEAVVAGKPLMGAGPFAFGKPMPTMLMFVKERAASVKDQLSGKDEGFVLGKRKPGDGKGPPGPPPFEEMVEPALVKALDSDKDGKLGREEFEGGFGNWFAAWDTAKAGSLSEEQIRKGLNKALPFPFFGPPGKEGEGPKDGGKPGGEKAASK